MSKPIGYVSDFAIDVLERIETLVSVQIALASEGSHYFKHPIYTAPPEADEAEAEIARLTDYNARLHADIAEIGKDNDELEAEISRLRDVIRIAKDALRGHDPEQPYMEAIRAALKAAKGE